MIIIINKIKSAINYILKMDILIFQLINELGL